MINNLLRMSKSVVKSWETQLCAVIALLIGSNAYFVQRIITQLDNTTSQVYLLREQVAHIETHLEDEAKRAWQK